MNIPNQAHQNPKECSNDNGIIAKKIVFQCFGKYSQHLTKYIQILNSYYFGIISLLTHFYSSLYLQVWFLF